MLDLGNVAISIFLTGTQNNTVTGAFNNIINETPGLVGPQNAGTQSITNYGGYIFVYIIKQLAVMVGAVFVAILGFIFLVRNFLLYFLVAISPAAYLAMVLPMTKKYFQLWWSWFLKWVFMPVVSVFWLWLAGVFFASTELKTGWVLPLAFAGFCFYMAITTPFKLGGAAVSGWKKAADWSRKKGQETANYGTSRLAQHAQLKASETDNKFAKGFWNAVSTTSAGANPETYRKGWKARTTAAAGKREKAILKSAPYGRVAGREAQLAAKIAKEFEDRKFQDVRETAAEIPAKVQPLVSFITGGSAKGEMGLKWQKWLTENGGVAGTTAQQRNEQAAILIRSSNEQTLGRSGIDKVKDARGKGVDLGEGVAIIQKAFQQRRQRGAAGVISGTTGQFFAPSSTTGTPGGPTPVTSPELVQIEDTLQEMSKNLSSQGEKGEGADVDRTMADVVKPTNVGVGAAHIPTEINARIIGIDDVAARKLRDLQAGVAKAANTQATRLAQKEESALNAIAQQLKSGKTPDQIIGSADEAQSMLDRGDIAGAQQIVTREITPGAGPSLDLMNKKSSHE